MHIIYTSLYWNVIGTLDLSSQSNRYNRGKVHRQPYVRIPMTGSGYGSFLHVRVGENPIDRVLSFDLGMINNQHN